MSPVQYSTKTAVALQKTGLAEQSADRLSSPAADFSPIVRVFGQCLLLPRSEWERFTHEASS